MVTDLPRQHSQLHTLSASYQLDVRIFHGVIFQQRVTAAFTGNNPLTTGKFLIIDLYTGIFNHHVTHYSLVLHLREEAVVQVANALAVTAVLTGEVRDGRVVASIKISGLCVVTIG